MTQESTPEGLQEDVRHNFLTIYDLQRGWHHNFPRLSAPLRETIDHLETFFKTRSGWRPEAVKVVPSERFPQIKVAFASASLARKPASLALDPQSLPRLAEVLNARAFSHQIGVWEHYKWITKPSPLWFYRTVYLPVPHLGPFWTPRSRVESPYPYCLAGADLLPFHYYPKEALTNLQMPYPVAAEDTSRVLCVVRLVRKDEAQPAVASVPEFIA